MIPPYMESTPKDRIAMSAEATDTKPAAATQEWHCRALTAIHASESR